MLNWLLMFQDKLDKMKLLLDAELSWLLVRREREKLITPKDEAASLSLDSFNSNLDLLNQCLTS